jgi:hypothetical protein
VNTGLGMYSSIDVDGSLGQSPPQALWHSPWAVRHFFQFQHHSNRLVVLGKLWVSSGKISGIFDQRPVTAGDVDQCHEELVWHLLQSVPCKEC